MFAYQHTLRKAGTIALVCALALALAGGIAGATDRDVGPGYTYATITAAVAAANPGDNIIVHYSTYTEGQINLNKANLTVRGASGEQMPKLTSTAGIYSNMIVINADGITIEGLEITHSSGSQYGYGIGDLGATAAHVGWSVQNCVIHDCRSAIYNGKLSQFSFLNNIVYNNYGTKLTLDATASFVCTGNFFYASTRGAKNFTIAWYTGNGGALTGDTIVSYNYFAGGWNQFMVSGQSADTPSGSRTITIEHNTFDGTLSAWYPGDFGNQLLAFWDGSGYTYNSHKIAIRNNLFVASGWYGLVNDDDGYTGGFIGDEVVQNCLFWNNYWKYWPDYRQTKEWFGTLSQAQVGWTSTGGNFVMDNCPTQDPLFFRTGTTAGEYYALRLGSPAIDAATDGTNIGAWQNSVDNITPSSGLNNGSVSITNLAGEGFISGADIRLTKAGQSDIVATNVVVVDPTKITCDLDLTGKAAGLWNVVVTNAGGSPVSLDNGFEITLPPLPPVANAGPDQTIQQGPTAQVTLDGSGSHDPRGLPLTYVWKDGATQIATGVRPTVTLAHGEHHITLTVTNTAMLSNSDETKVIVDRPPVANSQDLIVNLNTPKSLTLVATDPDGDPLTYRTMSPPAHGSLTGVTPTLIYTATRGYLGADRFTFCANDGWLDSNTAPVGLGLAMNCSGPAVPDWRPDSSYLGGQAIYKSSKVSGVGSVSQTVYQTQRTGMFSYSIPAPNGQWTVRLYFAEIEFGARGARLFDVYIEDQRVLTNFDIFAAAGGKNKAIVREFTVPVVNGGGLQIRFVPRKMNACIAGIAML